MKMVTVTLKNASLTPEEFGFITFYLHMAWPCKQVDDGIVLQSTPVDSVYYYPKKTENVVSAEEFMRRNIRDICVKVLTHHGEPGIIEKSYSLDFNYWEKTTLYSPLHLALFENHELADAYDDCTIPDVFVEAINSAIRSHPLSRADKDGLIHYFSCSDEVYEAFIKEHVKSIHPYVEIADGILRFMLEINSDCPLPESALPAIKNDMEYQCRNGWGQEIEVVDIPLKDAVIYEPDSLLGLRSEMELKYPDYTFRALNNPSLAFYIYDVELNELQTADK